MAKEIIIVTTNDIPGYKVTEVYGEVFGLIVRSRDLFSNIGASFRTIFGGVMNEVAAYGTAVKIEVTK